MFMTRVPRDYEQTLKTKPEVTIEPIEHRDFAWKTPVEALKLKLIPDEDYCIRAYYKI